MKPPLGVVAAAVIIAASPARAQGVSLKTQLSQRQAEVGERITLQLSAMVPSGDQSPGSPRLKVPAGIVVQGPSVSTQRHVSIAGGRMEHARGDLDCRLEHETAPGHPRVRYDQIRGVEGHLVIQQQVQVDAAGSPTFVPATSQLALDLV